MNLGWAEVLLIAFVVLILFGAKRIPEMMRAMGQGVKEFKKAANDLTSDSDAGNKPSTPPAAAETKPDANKSA